MTYILARLSPNNKFQIKRYRIAEGYRGRKKGSETASESEQRRHAETCAAYEARQKVLRFFETSEVRVSHKEIYLEKSLPLPGLPVETRSHKEVLETTVKTYPSHIKEVVRLPKDQYAVVKTPLSEFREKSACLLDILKESQQRPKRHCSWGEVQRPKVFRRQAGEKILEGGAIIDRFCGRENSSMLTLTLPGSTRDAMDVISRYSGWIVNRVLQVIRRSSTPEAPVFWFFVWEHQKRGALHLHLCLGWNVLWQKRQSLAYCIKDKWFQCLLELQEKAGVDCFARKGFGGSWRGSPDKWQWDCQDIKKSVAVYFSKYCQKNAAIASVEEQKLRMDAKESSRKGEASRLSKEIFYPSRYWGSSQSIKRWSKYLTKSVKFAVPVPEDVEKFCERIRSAFLGKWDFESVSVHSFQIVCPKTDIVISSGVVETYCVPADFYPSFWVSICEEVLGKSVCMDAMLHEFLHTGFSSC